MKKILLIILAVLNLGVPVFALIQIAKFSFRIFTPFELIMLIVLIIISIHGNSIIFRKYIFKRKTRSIAIPENSESEQDSTPLDIIKFKRRLIIAIFTLYTLIAVALPAFFFSNTIYVFMNAYDEDIEKITEQVVYFKPIIEDIYLIYQERYKKVDPEDCDQYTYLSRIFEARCFNGDWLQGDGLQANQFANEILFIRYPYYSIVALYNLDKKSWRFKTCSAKESDYFLELRHAGRNDVKIP